MSRAVVRHRGNCRFLVPLPVAMLGVSFSSELIADVHMRAREHYEVVDFTLASPDTPRTVTYRGFTNTINLWYETPFHYLVGLAGSPLLAYLHSPAAPATFASNIRLVHLGLEGKVFPLTGTAKVFLRGGIYDASLSTYGSAGQLHGSSGLFGVGYEFTLSGVGLAPEISWRQGHLGQGVSFTGTAPAIGVHFYEML